MTEELLDKNDYIMNPFMEEGEELPMCIATYLNNHYIGGFAGFDDQGRVIVMLPLIYREIPDPRNNQVAQLLDSVFKFNPLVEMYFIKADGFYLMKSFEKGDKSLVKAYEETITSFRAAQSGIIMPDVTDLSKFRK